MSTRGEDIVDYLKQFIGTKYVWGGNSLTNGVDCSGLIQQGFKHFGIDLPRVTNQQIGQGKAIGIKGLRAGDLVFFDTNPDRSGPDHVGLYIGGGKMIEAPRPGKSVQITDMTQGYYVDRFMGGRRINGVTSTGSSSADAADTKTEEKLSPEEMAANYGWAYGFLTGTPELNKLFKEAVKDTWTADKFQAELRDTDWWKKTSESARNAQVMKSTDPATWRATLDAAKLQVRQLAATVGAAVPPAKLSKIAESVVTAGLDEDGIRNILGQYVNFSKEGNLTGEAGMHEYTMKKFAAENGVSISDQAIKNQAQLIVRKLATTEDYENQIRQQAISKYPSYADQLNAGQTMTDIADPYIQMMSDELEVPDTGITINNPTIRTALNGVNASGVPSGLSLGDFQSSLRLDPRWTKTQKAQDQTMTVANKVLSDMGLVS